MKSRLLFQKLKKNLKRQIQISTLLYITWAKERARRKALDNKGRSYGYSCHVWVDEEESSHLVCGQFWGYLLLILFYSFLLSFLSLFTWRFRSLHYLVSILHLLCSTTLGLQSVQLIACTCCWIILEDDTIRCVAHYWRNDAMRHDGCC